MQGVAGGSQGVLDLLTGNDALRGILESAGFVLDDVLQDAGLVLEAEPEACCLQHAGCGTVQMQVLRGILESA